MSLSFLIIDDFLADPHAFRQNLLSLDYPKSKTGAVYPGRNSGSRHVIPGLEVEISRIVQEKLKPVEQTAHGKSRITLAKDVGKADIHTDDKCYWSAILYMSLDEHCQGGTDFFRHIETGTDQANYLSENLAKLGVKTPESAQKKYTQIMEKDGMNREKWQKTMHVPMKFNRLVLLRPWLWHTACPGFGDSLKNGRLIYVMFFDASEK
jgi:hypothetical protein